MPGRRPKPTKLKVIQGNPGRRPLNEAEPRPPRVLPEAPAGLEPVARAAWDRLAPMLHGMGLLTVADLAALERLCCCAAELADLNAAIAEHGRTYQTVTDTGVVMHRARPEVGMRADADRRFKSYLVEFGLTPAARPKVRAEGAATDPLNGYFG